MSTQQIGFLFILFAVLTLEPIDAAVPAVDTGGEKVGNGWIYYIREVIKVNGTDVITGGFGFGDIDPYPNCNLTFSPFDACCVGSFRKKEEESDIGYPAEITQRSKLNTILLSTDTSIEIYFMFFNIAASCHSDHVWRLFYDEETKEHYVISGRDCCGTPPSYDGRSWFRVEKSGKYYSILGCYSVCEGCKAVCKGLGYKMIKGHSLLAFSDVPAKFVFEKRPSIPW